MKQFNVDASLLNRLLEGAQRQGLNYDRILLSNGVSRLSLESDKSPVPIESFAQILKELIAALDDEYVGLAKQKQPIGSFRMMVHSCISTENIRHSLMRCANFWNLFNNTFRHELQLNSDRAVYILHPINQDAASEMEINPYLVESILLSIHRFHCWLAGQFIPLRSITFSYPNPQPDADIKANFYNTKMKFNAPFCRIELDPEHMTLPNVQNKQTVAHYLQGIGISLMYQPRSFRLLADQVRQWLDSNIKQNNHVTSLNDTAQHFAISQQVLHRRLQQEGTSFKQIKADARRDIAINLLTKPHYKVEQVASLVGFSEPSAFIRAFKGWTGKTPLHYRSKNN